MLWNSVECYRFLTNAMEFWWMVWISDECDDILMMTAMELIKAMEFWWILWNSDEYYGTLMKALESLTYKTLPPSGLPQQELHLVLRFLLLMFITWNLCPLCRCHFTVVTTAASTVNFAIESYCHSCSSPAVTILIIIGLFYKSCFCFLGDGITADCCCQKALHTAIVAVYRPRGSLSVRRAWKVSWGTPGPAENKHEYYMLQVIWQQRLPSGTYR